MASAMLKSSNHLQAVEWMWQYNANPSSESELATWRPFSDVENLIIEEAFASKQPRAKLDGYYIDLYSNEQISHNDHDNRKPVKRVMRKREDKHLREARFMDLPVALDHSLGGQYGFVASFVIEVRRHLRLQPKELPSTKPELIPMLVDKAAQGFVAEGKDIGKQCEAEKLAGLLREKKNSSMKEVWKCCAYLYSLESFLYKTLNATMRLVGCKGDDKIWRSKVPTLGPFCLLLWDDPFNTRMKTDIELYRGANLSAQQIATYKEMTKNEEGYGSFQGFSSCSRNRVKAKAFGNVLFIMQVKFAFIADISALSEYPNEEEELITPGVCFRVVHVHSDLQRNTHSIYLELRQRWSGKWQQRIVRFDF